MEAFLSRRGTPDGATLACPELVEGPGARVPIIRSGTWLNAAFARSGNGPRAAVSKGREHAAGA